MSLRSSAPAALVVFLAGSGLSTRAQAPHPRLELAISASTARRGASGSFLITLKAPDGTSVVALEWELAAEPDITIETGDILAGSAAESGQKTITCGARQAKHICILAGGQKSLPAGTIAVVRYKVSAHAHPGASTVRVENANGTSSAGLKKIEIGGAQAVITIQ